MALTEEARAAEHDPGNEGLFARKASGLVREMGARDTFSVSVGGINSAAAIAITFVYLAFASNADLTWPYIIAAAVMVPLALTYAQLVASIPRTGGDFVWLSRIFHPAIGAAVGVGFFLLTMLLFGTNSEVVANYGLPELFRTLGVAFNSSGLVTFSETLTGQTGTMIAAGIIIVICCVVAVFGAHAVGRVLFWCIGAAVVGILLMSIVAVVHSGGDFRTAYDQAHGAGAYQAVIEGAKKEGVSLGSTFSGFASILPFAALGYWGFTVANFPAGELKRPATSYVRGTLLGLALGALLFVISWIAIKHLVGLQFWQSASALSGANSGAFEAATGGGAPVVSQYYPNLVGGDFLSVVISLGIAIGTIINPLVWLLVASRLAFALSFDRLLPAQLADVNERTHAPIKAILLVAAGALLFVYLTVYSTGFASAIRNQVLIFGVVFTLGSLAGIGLVFRRRDLYDASPHVIGGKWLGQPPILWVAAVSAILQAVLLVIAATNESISGGYDAASVATLVGVCTVGLLAYVVSRLYYRSRGVDLRLAMKELPPE
jgi:amino acid transporter